MESGNQASKFRLSELLRNGRGLLSDANSSGARLASLLGSANDYDPGYTYADLLPLKKNNTTKAIEPAIPGTLKGLLGAMSAPGRAYAGLLDVDSPAGVAEANNVAFNLLGANLPVGVPTGSLGMLKTPVGRIPQTGTETAKLADMLQRAAEVKGYGVERSDSAISPSRYVTLYKENPNTFERLNELQVRLSNHADKYPELANGTRMSVDPSTENSFEQAANWLGKNGYPTSLSSRYKNVPTHEEYFAQQAQARQIQDEMQQQARRAHVAALPKTYGDFNISSTKLNSGGRRYDLKNPDIGAGYSVYSSSIPDAIKTNADRNVLYEYLLAQMKKPGQ
jgi:hypothetical protein